jgi:hypothetical protein
MAEQIFPKGIRCFAKHDNAPEFVICSAVIDVAEFTAFVAERPDLLSDYNGKKQLKLQVLSGKEGKGPYMAVDTYKATASGATVPAGAPPPPVWNGTAWVTQQPAPPPPPAPVWNGTAWVTPPPAGDLPF